MGLRRQGRELALQLLFQVEMTQDGLPEVAARFWRSRQVDPSARAFADKLATGTLSQLQEIDRRIETAAENWRLERMAAVDRNVLRLAVYELISHGATPPAVIIDEAIEVVRRFGAPESAPFINGILDSIRQAIEKAAFRT